MSNSVFSPAREGYLIGEVGWTVPTIKVALVRGYTFDATHKFVSDVTGAGGTLHATSSALASKTGTDGVADAADVTFTTPAANANDHSVLVFQSSAIGGGADVAASAQRVIAYIDTGTGLPVQPNGANVTLTFDSGANRIFHL
jgi:hypothetical protein